MSERASASFPSRHSGAMYRPRTVPCCVRPAGVVASIEFEPVEGIDAVPLASPKSSSSARFRHHYVAGFEIAVHDAGTMRGVQGAGDLDTELQRLFERQRSPRNPVRERFALEVLHHEECRSLVLADVVNGADVRVIELGHRACLAFEPLAQLRVRRKRGWQHLDCHGAIEAPVARDTLRPFRPRLLVQRFHRDRAGAVGECHEAKNRVRCSSYPRRGVTPPCSLTGRNHRGPMRGWPQQSRRLPPARTWGRRAEIRLRGGRPSVAALNCRRCIEEARASLPVERAADRQLFLGFDVTGWAKEARSVANGPASDVEKRQVGGGHQLERRSARVEQVHDSDG